MEDSLMKLEEKKVNRSKLFIFAGMFALVSIPLYMTQHYAVANILVLIALGAPFNVLVLNPGVAWFQGVFLPWLETTYSKTILFALLLATIPSFHGYYMKGGALEVGKASTVAFVWTSVAIILTNYILTQLLLSK